MKRLSRLAVARRFTLALSAGFALLLATGCGGSKPEPTPAPAAPAAAQAPAAAPAPKAKPAVAVDAPATVKPLGLLPAAAQVGIAIPAPNGIIDTLLKLDPRFEDVDIRGELDKIVRDLKRDLAVPDAETLGDVAKAKGIDFDAPIAVFADLTKSVDGLKQAIEEVQGYREPKLSDADIPNLAVALGVSSRDAAQETLDLLIALGGAILGASGTEEVGGVTVNTLGDYAYFFADNHLVIGMTPMVKGAAERVSDPVAFRYGTADCPPTAPQEAVAVMYGDRALPLFQAILPALANNDAANALIGAQLAQLEKAFGGNNDDPIVMNLALGENGVSLTTRVDTAAHPGILENSGQAQPLQLAQLLPDKTLAMIALGLTDEYKKQINDQILPAASEALNNPGMAQGMSMGKQAIEMLGNEVVIGISEVPDDFPAAYILLGLSNPEPTKALLQMLVPMMPDPELADYGISSVAAPIPVPLSIAFVDNMVLLSNSVDGMKEIINASREGKTSGLFSRLGLDPSVPRYQAVVFDTKLLTDVVVPLSALQGGLPGDVKPVVDLLGAQVNDLRLLSDMDGSWWTTKLSIDLKDAA